jgi:hypothetical protein
MNAFASLLTPLFGSRAERENISLEDQNDPADKFDLLGITCDVHGCSRMLDEAPLVSPRSARRDFADAKRQLFPNSWSAVASITPSGSWFHRARRPKMVTVRYCEACRAAAEQWMHEHLEE